MFSRRAVLLSLLLFSSPLSAVASGATETVALTEAFALPVGAENLLVAPLDDGSLIAASVGLRGTTFYQLPASTDAQARELATFDFEARAEPAALTAPRLAGSTFETVAIAFEESGGVKVAVVNPVYGSQAFEVRASLPSQVALHPSVAVREASVLVAYYAVSAAGAQACVASFDALSGSEQSRSCVDATGVPFPAILSEGSAYSLVLFGSTRAAIYTIEGSSLVAQGEAALGGYAASLSVAGGRLVGIVSDATGTSRVSAPLNDLARVTRVALPIASPTVDVAAAVSHDGRLAAAGRSLSGPWVLSEGGLLQYTVSARGGAFAFAAATDAYGLARAFVAEGPSTSRVASAFPVGDPYAVRVSITGPASVLPSDWATLSVTLTAVRLPVSVVGLGVVAPDGWSAQSPSFTATLAAGQSASTDVRVRAPPGTPSGSYNVRLTPAVLESAIQHSHTQAVVVDNGASSLSAAYTGTALELEPGGSAVVGVQVTNRGATAALADIRVGSGESGLIVSPSASTVTVAAGATEMFSFVVTAPSSALPQGSVRLTFDVLPADGAAIALDVPAAVLPVFLPELIVGSSDLSGAPGGGVVVPARVVNHGNTAGFVTVSASTIGLPDSALPQPQAALLVPAYGAVDAGLVLTIPAAAAADQRFSVSVAAALEAGVALSGARTLFGRVLPVVSVGATYTAGPEALPGGTSLGKLTLSNSGNRAVTFSLGLDGANDGFAVVMDGSASGGIVVEASSSVEIPLAVRVPREAAPGLREIEVLVLSDARAPLSLVVPVVVGEVHVFAIRVLAPTIQVRDPAVEKVELEVALSSGSNTPEQVSLDFGGAEPSLFEQRADGSFLPVAPGDFVQVAPFTTKTVRAVVAVGLVPGQTSREVAVAAGTLSGLTSSDSATILRPLADPRVVDLSILAPGRGGVLHTVFANIANGGPTTAAGFSVRLIVDGALVANEPLTPLSPGVTRLISFSFVPRADSQDVVVKIVSDQPAYDADLANNEALLVYATPGMAPAQPSGPLAGGQAVPAAAASFSILAIIAIALTEVGKSTFISLLFLPLYVKLKPGEVLDQYLRGQIHGYIIANPGEHYNAIKEQLGVTNGALAYHLRVLEKSGYIRASRDGMYKRFYPVGVKIPKRRRLSTFQEAIVKAVRDQPALSQKDLAELLGVSNQVINYHVKQLENANIIRLERDGRASKIFLGPDAPPVEPQPGAPAAPATQ